MRKYFNTNGDPITFNGRAILVGDTICVWHLGRSKVFTIKDESEMVIFKSNCTILDKIELLNR